MNRIQFNIYDNKCITFNKFKSILLSLKPYNKKFIKYIKKNHINIVSFTFNNKKYVAIINPYKNYNSIINKITLSLSKNGNKKIFIHSHGINGYEYDLINYFTNNDFIKSTQDKDVCIFFNNCSCLFFMETFKKHIKESINRQKNIINLIIKASLLKSDTELILSGFSYGCVLNTYILSSIDEFNLKKINSIFLIEEAIPNVKYLTEPIEIRYKRLKYTCARKVIFGKIRLVFIPPNDILEKNHPISLTYNVIDMINNDIDIQHTLYSCCIINDATTKQKHLSKTNGFVKNKKLSELEIKFFPQKYKIW